MDKEVYCNFCVKLRNCTRHNGDWICGTCLEEQRLKNQRDAALEMAKADADQYEIILEKLQAAEDMLKYERDAKEAYLGAIEDLEGKLASQKFVTRELKKDKNFYMNQLKIAVGALEKLGDGPDSKYKAGVDAIEFAVFANETACEALSRMKNE